MMMSERSRCVRDGSVTWSTSTGVALGSALMTCGSCSDGSLGSDARMRATCCCTSTAATLMSVPKANCTRTVERPWYEFDSRMSMPETRLTAFSMGRVTVDSIVSGETFPYATVTLTTGGANAGSNATASRGAAKMPSTTMAAESMATATRRVTANRAMDMGGRGPRSPGDSLSPLQMTAAHHLPSQIKALGLRGRRDARRDTTFH